MEGGDLNTDLTSDHPISKRTSYLQNMMSTYQMQTDFSGKTYMTPDGRDCTEIDYFLVKQACKSKYSKKRILTNIPENTSDHHPISITYKGAALTVKKRKSDTRKASKINWDKIDTQLYAAEITRGVLKLGPSELQTTEQIDDYTMKLMNLVSHTSDSFAKKHKTQQSKPKLKVWTSDIKTALKEVRLSYKAWASQGKPADNDSHLLQSLKACPHRISKKKHSR